MRKEKSAPLSPRAPHTREVQPKASGVVVCGGAEHKQLTKSIEKTPNIIPKKPIQRVLPSPVLRAVLGIEKYRAWAERGFMPCKVCGEKIPGGYKGLAGHCLSLDDPGHKKSHRWARNYIPEKQPIPSSLDYAQGRHPGGGKDDFRYLLYGGSNRSRGSNRSKK